MAELPRARNGTPGLRAPVVDYDWDSELMANASLGIGEVARRDPRLAMFFPNRTGALTAEGWFSEGVSD